MNFYDFHRMGGLLFMLPLLGLLMAIISLIAIEIIHYLKTNELNKNRLSWTMQLGGFALAFGIFGTLLGLFSALSDLENMADQLPLPVIIGGLRVASITALYGLGIFLFTSFVILILKWFGRNQLSK